MSHCNAQKRKDRICFQNNDSRLLLLTKLSCRFNYYSYINEHLINTWTQLIEVFILFISKKTKKAEKPATENKKEG
jgi:hypothetical protein